MEIAQGLLQKASLSAKLKTASIFATGYDDAQFDCVIARDVLDHISKTDAIIALKELCRIAKPGGIILFTLDSLDQEYRAEPHIVNADGDYVYTEGKWDGMVFHPYSKQEVGEIIPPGVACEVNDHDGEMTVLLMKIEDRKI